MSIRVSGLSLERGGRQILRDLDFRVEAGSLVGLIGPNGAGKSSLLRCLNGLAPARGRVELLGRDLHAVGRQELARTLALMHQSTSPAFPLRVEEVVMLGRYPHQGRFSAPSRHDRDLVDQALDFTDTTQLRERMIDTLSGGERQRVFLAMTLAQDTPILLLDEPTASLDLSHQEAIFSLARRIAEGGRTVVVAVHDLKLASRWCHCLMLMAEGKLLAMGSPEEVLTRDHLEEAYKVKVRVWHNNITGLLDFDLHEGSRGDEGPHCHVIGGGGSAAGVLRLLGDLGLRQTAGVLAPGDSDLLVAGAYGVPVITSQPFSPIGDQAFQDNCSLAAHADLTIVCAMALGSLNLRNLEAALCARHLVVLDDGHLADRDFSGGQAGALHDRLCRQGTVLAPGDLPDWIHAWLSRMEAP